MKRTRPAPSIPERFLQPVEAAGRRAARVAELLPYVRPRRGVVDSDALRELKAFGSLAVPGLIEAAEMHGRRRRITRRTIAGTVLAMAIGIGYAPARFTDEALLMGFTPFFVMFILCLASDVRALVKKIGYWLFLLPDDRPIVQALMEMRDVRTVSLLTRAMRRERNGEIKSEMRACLTELLPRLAYGDRNLLEAEDRRILRWWLKDATGALCFPLSDGQPEFIHAIVKALVQIRDVDSLPALRALAARPRYADVQHIAALGVAELEGRIAAGEAVHP